MLPGRRPRARLPARLDDALWLVAPTQQGHRARMSTTSRPPVQTPPLARTTAPPKGNPKGARSPPPANDGPGSAAAPPRLPTPSPAAAAVTRAQVVALIEEAASSGSGGGGGAGAGLVDLLTDALQAVKAGKVCGPVVGWDALACARIGCTHACVCVCICVCGCVHMHMSVFSRAEHVGM
jgi:hypothetical protein